MIIPICRSLTWHTIRLRISSCGIVDVMMYDGRQDVLALQQEDLSLFGSLILALGCNNLTAANNPAKALDILSKQYSTDLRHLALFLTTKHGPPKVNSTPECHCFHQDSYIESPEHRTRSYYDQ